MMAILSFTRCMLVVQFIIKIFTDFIDGMVYHIWYTILDFGKTEK